jgi:hypothetical protein
MGKKKLPKGLRKYIRQEKARIRREVLDIKEQDKLIQELNQKFFEKLKQNHENQRNLQLSNK